MENEDIEINIVFARFSGFLLSLVVVSLMVYNKSDKIKIVNPVDFIRIWEDNENVNE